MADPSTESINLDRLLKRLEHTLSSPEAETKLAHSTYERTRVGANVEYARTLLLRLEHEASSIKTQSRKQSTQADLQMKREQIKQMNRRLIDLAELNDSDSSDDYDDDEDGDEHEGDAENPSSAMREFAPARHDTINSIDRNPVPTSDSTAEAMNAVESVMRSRRGPSTSTSQPGNTTATASSSALFNGRGTEAAATNTSTSASSLPQTETLLSHNRHEQEALTSSLVALAKSLKQSSVQFAQSLDSEKSVLGRAESGLDANALGMEAAGRRMGALRRMTEGQGWWGRIKLYAIIAALWVAAFLIVFVGPKLRF